MEDKKTPRLSRWALRKVYEHPGITVGELRRKCSSRDRADVSGVIEKMTREGHVCQSPKGGLFTSMEDKETPSRKRVTDAAHWVLNTLYDHKDSPDGDPIIATLISTAPDHHHPYMWQAIQILELSVRVTYTPDGHIHPSHNDERPDGH